MREADILGKGGKAWKNVSVPSPRWPATLTHWLVNAPGRHAFWEYWTVSAVHLRPYEGGRAAVLKYPKAEHELLVMALEPGKELNPDGDDFPYMFPPDLVFQFDGLGDEGAAKLVEGYVRQIVEGGLTPDSDARNWWQRTLQNVASQMKRNKSRIIWLPASETPHPSKVT